MAVGKFTVIAFLCVTIVLPCNSNKTAKYEEQCNKDIKCSEPFVCSKENECECREKYRVNDDSTECLAELGEACKTSSDCHGGVMTECIENKCSCGPLYDKNEENECKPLVGGVCSYNSDCRELLGFFTSSCEMNINDKTGKCECKSTALSHKKRCYEEIHSVSDECTIDEQCFNFLNGSQCKNNKCVCKKGYEFINDTICKPNKAYNQPCTSDMDCMGENVQCLDKICHCPATQHFVDGICKTIKNYNETCLLDHEMCDFEKNMACYDGVCKCQHEYVFTKTNSSCVSQGYKLPPISTLHLFGTALLIYRVYGLF